MNPETIKVRRMIFSKMTGKEQASLLDMFEARNSDFFSREFCIDAMVFNEAFSELMGLLRQFAELCKLYPAKAEIWREDLLKQKRHLLSKMLRKSLLLT